MASGLLALLDDVAAITKVASASLDDVVGQAAKAGTKAAGIVIDDAAVSPRYVVGFAADRELPIVAKIAWGSVRNKMLFLLPAALALSSLAPWSIMPLLVLGGLFLCMEGYHKVHDMVRPAHAKETAADDPAVDPKQLEDRQVAGAIRTDFILSAEIMAITLSAVGEAGFAMKATVLAVVGLGITLVVYGAVAVIVKADDVGVALARRPAPLATLGRAIVKGMPIVLAVLAFVGTLAMLWVGGGIVLHGLAVFGFDAPEVGIHAVSEALGGGAPGWLAGAAIAGVVGLVLGALTDWIWTHGPAPLVKRWTSKGRGR
jgi:predicted DNA repair protein MutK